MQTSIDFTAITHTKENNKFSEAILDEQYERLNHNCKVIYDALKRGERLSGAVVVTKYGMLEYRRRFKSLIDAGIPVKSEMVGNCKVWYL